MPITEYAVRLLSNRGRFPYRAGMEPPPPLPRRVAWFAPWRWRRRWWAYAGLPAVFGGLYILASGPAAWIVGRHASTAATVAIIYRPVLFVRHRSEAIAQPLDIYGRLWSRIGWYGINLNHLQSYELIGQSGLTQSEMREKLPRVR